MGDRNRCLQVSLTREAAQSVRDNARNASMSISTYLRRIVMDGLGRRPPRNPPGNGMEELLSDIRDRGWMVAVHNDYRQHGELNTFWLFTKGYWSVKGEDRTDRMALMKVLDEIRKVESQVSPDEQWPNSSDTEG